MAIFEIFLDIVVGSFIYVISLKVLERFGWNTSIAIWIAIIATAIFAELFETRKK